MHCHQLMGIARRKAGTEVQCPTCRHNVVVPKEEEVPAASAPKPRAMLKAGDPVSGTGAAPLFERSDFDEVLRGPEAPPRIARPSPKNGSTAGRALEEAPHVHAPSSLLQNTIPPNGIFLSSNRATILAVAGIILLAVAFGAGLLVGRYCL
jgi:hypothetical protein